MYSKNPLSRRNFLILAGAAGAGLAQGCSKSASKPESVRPVEYAGAAIELLERQHGVTRRALAVMSKIKDGINAQTDIQPETVRGAVEIVGSFMIDCHQLMEEKFVFPVFAASPNTSELIAVLRQQHAAAFRLIEILKPLSANFSPKDRENQRKTANMLHLLARMSQAHASWEDTALFPLLHSVVPATSYDRLSSDLQGAETEFLGQNGFDETLQTIARYENSLGIGNLASFTPQPEDLS
ncbi:MAG: hemerythrin domain-containing protein [Syntrophobacteraceae bacterium]|nr:hemerythrin domain-containing protein [Syntrophobacteraceae bacterium]